MKPSIYIASSWKNEHGVTLLTKLLRQHGYDVVSWIENNHDENIDAAMNAGKPMNFEQ